MCLECWKRCCRKGEEQQITGGEEDDQIQVIINEEEKIQDYTESNLQTISNWRRGDKYEINQLRGYNLQQSEEGKASYNNSEKHGVMASSFSGWKIHVSINEEEYRERLIKDVDFSKELYGIMIRHKVEWFKCQAYHGTYQNGKQIVIYDLSSMEGLERDWEALAKDLDALFKRHNLSPGPAPNVRDTDQPEDYLGGFFYCTQEQDKGIDQPFEGIRRAFKTGQSLRV